jgi:hypothetical protein
MGRTPKNDLKKYHLVLLPHSIDDLAFKKNLLMPIHIVKISFPFSFSHDGRLGVRVGPADATGRGQWHRVAAAGADPQLYGGLHHRLLHRYQSTIIQSRVKGTVSRKNWRDKGIGR